MGVDVTNKAVTDIIWYHSFVNINMTNDNSSIAKWKPSSRRGNVDDENRVWNLEWDELRGSAVVVGEEVTDR